MNGLARLYLGQQPAVKLSVFCSSCEHSGMPGAHTQRTIADAGTGSAPFIKLVRKIALLVGTDDFAPSNCRALLKVLSDLAREVVVIAPSFARRLETEALGATVIDFDCRASLSNPAYDALAAGPEPSDEVGPLP